LQRFFGFSSLKIQIYFDLFFVFVTILSFDLIELLSPHCF
jgi:hypothetical protein